MKLTNFLITVFLAVCVFTQLVFTQTLEVKPNRSAIVKEAPTATAEHFDERLLAGTRVQKIGEVPRYYSIRLSDGQIGWSYKGNFRVVEDQVEPRTGDVTKASLLARTDVLKIIIIDVEVGDATLIICPAEDGQRDILLIDTGENDSDRILNALRGNGVSLSGKPINRFYITHYDHDHMGDAIELIPFSKVIYDHGNNNIKGSYKKEVDKAGVNRQIMALQYQETFSGGVSVECVAVNQATDFDQNLQPSSRGDNPNSIALIISYDNFDYFTAGDLTFKPEKSLAKQIRNCDAYHVNHHGSRATSSHIDFVKKLDPEVSVASNGTRFGHPTADVAKRLIDLGSKFFQTNFNPDSRANKPNKKFVADDTYNEDSELEDLEGAIGTITIVVDAKADKYYVIMPGLSLNEGTFDIEI